MARPVVPTYVDQHALAALGLAPSSRAAVAMLKRRAVPHVRDGRRCVARLSDVLAVLGLDALPVASTAPRWSPESVVVRLVRGGR
jgi:hypothetical protein